MQNGSVVCSLDYFTRDLQNFWSASTPLLPPCFAHTILIWIPCAIFWLLSPFEIASFINVKEEDETKRISAQNRKKQWILLIARLIGLILIWICSIFRVASVHYKEDVSVAVICAYILQLITVTCLIITTIFRYRRLVAPPSAYAWITLCSFAVAGFPELVSLVQLHHAKSAGSLLVTTLVFVQYIANGLSLITFSISDPLLEKDSQKWPEGSISFPNTLVFWWLLRLLVRGYRNVLCFADLYHVSDEERTRTTFEQFHRNLEHYFGRNELQKDGDHPGIWSMIKAIMCTFYKPVLVAAVLNLANTILLFVSPIITVRLMQLARNTEEPMWHGLVYVGIMFGASLIRSFMNEYHLHFMNKFGIRARAAIVAAVYRKALSMSAEARRTSNTGEIVNLMAVDSSRFIDVAPWLQLCWSSPLQVIIGIYFMYTSVGHAVWPGVAVMVMIFAASGVISEQMRRLQVKQLYEKDRRLKLLTEMLNGMKVVKLYAWEPAFERMVEAIRTKELKFLKYSSYLFGSVQVSYCCTHLLCCMAIFGTYCAINPTHNLTAEVAFFILTVFNLINIPITQLPIAANFTMMTLASISRLHKYFCGTDLTSYVETRPNSEGSVEIEHGSFTWDKDSKDCVLNDIALSVGPGELVAVVGPVGSGKTSLTNAICGEMLKRKGSVFVNGSLAYIAQQAWIQNLTVRDNILFGRPYDEYKYQRVIQACALKPDLALLSHGDMTVIGERGSNLSGGQKQRISMARAVYQDADIYLLDDPLSAVDVHVGKSIFEDVIGPKGLLKKKARLFVTHGINYLPFCDSVIVMESGRILASGSLEGLAGKYGIYADILAQNINQSNVGRATSMIHSATGSPGLLSRQPTDDSRQDAMFTDMMLQRLSSLRRSNTSVLSDRQNRPRVPSDTASEDVFEDEEESHVGNVDWKPYLMYCRYGGSALIMHGICLALSEASYMGGSMWLEHWTDTVPASAADGGNNSIEDSENIVSGEEGIGVLCAFTVSQLVTTLGLSLYFVWFLINSSTKVHKNLLESILRAPMAFFDTTPIGRLNNRFGKDMNTIDNQIPYSLSAIIHFIVIMVTFIIPVAYGTPFALVAILPLMLVYYFVQKFYVASSRQFRRLEAVTRSPIYSHFQEAIQGLSTIRAYCQQPRFADESDKLVDINNSAQMTLLASNRWFGIQLDFIGNLLMLGSSLSAVLSRASLLPGSVGLSISYALAITDVLTWGVREMSMLETEVVALERVKEYMDTQSEAEWTSRDHDKSKRTSSNWPTNGAVHFRDYSTRYRSGLPLVLRDVHCRILAGEKIGVVGRTGAGKSSLTLALFRLVEPVHGTIMIDNEDISTMGLHDLRRNLTIIPQEPVLFSGTLRQNVDPFDQYTDAELFRVLQLSHLTSFVDGLDSGLSHEISEGGSNLSVGQRQLLCLARALLRKTKILVLDEATASVDLETDALIQKTVQEQFADCTVITIAHRLNTILDCDRVMVLDSGRLVEFDSPRALVEDDSSEFGRMVKEAGIKVGDDEKEEISMRL